MRIDVEVNDREVKRFLERLEGRMDDLTPVMETVGEIVRSSVIKNFMAGGRPDEWQPTKAKSVYRAFRGKGRKKRKAYTVKGRPAKGFEGHAGGKKPLIDTGRLQSSITVRAYPDRAVIGTNVVYAAIHQFGGKAGRGRKTTIPARPFLMVQDEDWGTIRETLESFLVKGEKK